MTFVVVVLTLLLLVSWSTSTEVTGCNGIIHSDYSLHFSAITIHLYNQQHILKYSTDCSPVDGYFFLPLTELEGERQQIYVEVESPRGWSFREYVLRVDVDFENDLCTSGKDLVFEFVGFYVEGGVVSYGMDTGPNGVNIDLLRGEETVQNSLTTSDGYFQFQNVLPGKYTLRSSHKDFNLSQSAFEFEVTTDSVNVGSPIQVFGYDVTGFVSHDKIGISGVQVLIVSSGNADVLQSETCQKSIQDLENELKQIPYLVCVAVTGEDGKFRLSSISPGLYTINPFYKSDQTKFQLRPTQLKTLVTHSSVSLEDNFEVTGFQVYGSVIHLGIDDELIGIEHVQIDLRGKQGTLNTRTDKFGSYRFDEIVSDSYTVSAKLAGYDFEDVVLELSPSQTEITTLFPSKFEVSGKFELSKMSLRDELIHGVKVDFVSDTLHQTELSKDLSFRILLPKGMYNCSPNLSDELHFKGVTFSPETIQVPVTNTPVSGITFSQILSSISVRIKCLSSCRDLSTLLTAASTGQVTTRAVATDDVTAIVSYEDLLPGSYTVEIEDALRCWEDRIISVSLGRENGVVEFSQNGYILEITFSHDTSFDIVRTTGAFEDREHAIAGVNILCLPLPGLYHITPISCHQFEPKEAMFDTSQLDQKVSLTAVTHQTLTRIKADTNEITNENIKLVVTSGDDTTDTIYPSSVTNEDRNVTVLEFVIFAETGENLFIEPQAEQLLFLPTAYSVEITEVVCPIHLITFLANRGVVIKGSVKPPVELVVVELRVDSPNGEVLMAHTNADGEFSFGPLPKLDSYEIVPSSPGLLFEKKEENLFLVRRMGSVSVQVVDELERPLVSVLVSVHCGRIRMNNLTSETGTLLYSQLQVCEYYIKPSLKEYSFTPTGEIAAVELDSDIQVRFVGHKVHYSAYGTVTSLNQHPQWNIEVLARGLTDGCVDIAEKGETDRRGNFRIQGLKSKCKYRISVVSLSSWIENIIPGSFVVSVGSEDLREIHFRIYNRTEQHELTGNIEGPDVFMDRMQVKLYQETTRGLVHVSNVPVGMGGFFKYSLTRGSEEKEFILMVDSKTRIQGYTVSSDQSAVSFQEGKRHTSVVFRIERVEESDRLGGSFFQLTAALIAIFVVSRFSRIIRNSFQDIFGK